jgi:signal transduction histidine kinase
LTARCLRGDASRVAPGATETDGRQAIEARRNRALVGLLAIAFLGLVAAIAMAAWAQARNAEDSAAVEHTLRVESLINRMATLNERIETGRRGYLLTGEAGFLNVLERALAEAPRVLDSLAALVDDNSAQRPRVSQLRRLHDERQDDLVRTVALVRAGQREAAVASFVRDPATYATRASRTLVAEMADEERRLLVDRNARQRRTQQLLYAVFGAIGLMVIGVAIAIFVILRRYTRALTAQSAELARLNAGLEEMVQMRTAELQRANDEIQRFAYIVSHDLRSPLVNVMGFTAELDAARKTIADFTARLFERLPEERDHDMALAVEEDLPEAIGFIRTSTQKMDRLINSILKLSREGRRRLAPEPLDMDALVGGIIDTLHQRAAEMDATIKAAPLPDITSDRVAIEQILSNLIENAVKYGKPGETTQVRVTGERRGDRVHFDIADNGRGIEPRDHERIFELFRRSGTQDTPGEGIGLAHVRALAYRLGGLISVTSELGRGSTFRLSLPLILTHTE